MINRRILRIKAMQSLYSYKRNEESNFHLALDEVRDDFNMELLSVGKDHAKEYAARESKVTEVLTHTIREKKKSPETIGEEFDDKVLRRAFNHYLERNYKDFQVHKSRMVAEAEGIHTQYLKLLRLIFDLARIDTENLLSRNLVVDCLHKGEALQNAITQKNIQWDQDLVRQWYRLLKKDDALKSLLKTEHQNIEDDRKALKSFIYDFIFKNENVTNQLEEEDINWEENRDILKNMLSNTIKFVDKQKCEKAELYLLSRNWDEDRAFFIELFDECSKNEAYFDEVISSKSKKWAVDRIAMIDKILLELAITELVCFPNIPIKVTINEYIEISKAYSTPKSWQFINGMVDEIAKKLSSEGKINKSGRGLIDNK